MQSRFGAFVRGRRLALGLGLRKFCQEKEFDPAFISKLERGRLVIPGEETLKRLAAALDLEDGTPEWSDFLDLAAAEGGRIPEDLLSDEEVVELLPAVFRTFRSEKAGDDRLEELIQILKRS
jgi:transcriptional regulator with XRE-family HTH domain